MAGYVPPSLLKGTGLPDLGDRAAGPACTMRPCWARTVGGLALGPAGSHGPEPLRRSLQGSGRRRGNARTTAAP